MDALEASIILFLGFAFTAYYALRPRFKGGYWQRIALLFNLRFEKPFENLFLAGLAGVALQAVLVLCFGLPEAMNSAGATAFWLLLSGFCAPVWEESAFRGVFFEFPRWMNWRIGGGALLLASGVVFMAFHDYSLLLAMDFWNQRVVGHLAAGLLYGALYLRSRNLLPAIVAHGTGNAFLLLLQFAG